MRRLERSGKRQADVVLGERGDIQVLQHRKLLVHGHEESLQVREAHPEADALHAIAVLECEDDVTLVFGGEVVLFLDVVNDEREGRRICQHFFHRGAVCTDEAEVVGRAV
jgi:hypothetical protein